MMDEFNSNNITYRPPEFQAVFIIDYDDGRLFPLTEDCPKCLLPIANKRLLSYQFDMLAKSGITELYIVTPREYEIKISHFLADYIRLGMNIDLVTIDEMNGSADCLRAVSDRIRGDFICLHSDFISQYTLGELATMHRLCSSDLTMMLCVTNSKDVKRDEVDEEFIGICDDGRVMLKVPKLEVDEAICFSKPLLHHAPTLSLRQDLFDIGIYIMSFWVLEFLVSNRKISSIKSDLIPYLINRQYQNSDYLLKLIPALVHRNRPLKSVESWAIDSSKSIYSDEEKGQYLLDSFSSSNMRSSCDREPLSPPMKPSTNTTTTSDNNNANNNSNYPTTLSFNSSSNIGMQKDLLRCFALVYDTNLLSMNDNNFSISTSTSTNSNIIKSNSSNSSIAANTNTNVSSILLNRLVNIPTYLQINRDMSNFDPDLHLIGDGCDIHEKVTIKQCYVGQNVIIGQMSKLNNCVVMDNVIIGDNCTIQNSIICDKVIIENNCKINDCNIGNSYKVITGSKIKSESFSSHSN